MEAYFTGLTVICPKCDWPMSIKIDMIMCNNPQCDMYGAKWHRPKINLEPDFEPEPYRGG